MVFFSGVDQDLWSGIQCFLTPCIRDWIWDSGKKKSRIWDPESRINIRDHISNSLLKVLGLKAVLWIRIWIQQFKLYESGVLQPKIEKNTAIFFLCHCSAHIAQIFSSTSVQLAARPRKVEKECSARTGTRIGLLEEIPRSGVQIPCLT